MSRFPQCVLGLALAGFVLLAQPAAGQVGLINETLRCCGPAAPGSVILLGTNSQAGPSVRQVASGFPLVTNLGGTSIRVIPSGGVAVDAFILATESNFVRALLPSNTPIGEADLVVLYNGNVTGATRVQVAKSLLGLYTEDYASFPFGVARRTVQNVSADGNVTINSYVNPARPGQPVVLWGTGLGAAPGDEAAGQTPVNLQIPALQVILGGDKQGKILYAGRSGCCAGIDVVIFEVPQGIEGCNVPVWVRSNDDRLGSNEVMVSIGSQGACADSSGLLTEPEMRSGNLKTAQIAALSNTSWLVGFGSAARANAEIAPGTCTNEGSKASPFGLEFSPLDAGPAVDISTPRETLHAQRRNFIYDAPFNGQLDPGRYYIDNGNGGADVGPLRISFSPAAPALTWTNRDDITDASEPVGIQWQSDGPGDVVISGSFNVDGEVFGGFYCVEKANKGEFVVHSASYERALTGNGAVGQRFLHLYVWRRFSQRIDVPGFDVGAFTVLGVPQQKVIPLK